MIFRNNYRYVILNESIESYALVFFISLFSKNNSSLMRKNKNGIKSYNAVY